MATIEKSKSADAVTCAVVRNAGPVETANGGGVFTLQCFDKDGKLKWEEQSHNLVVNEGLDDMNTKYFTGSGYTAGGETLTVTQTPTIGNQTGNATVYLSFSNVTWTAALTARGALIYKSGSGNPSVCVLDFGGDKTSTTTFTVQFPAATNTAAIIRIS